MVTSSRSAATLQDVAREAGVSLATASRAINGSTRTVNAEYRDRVLAAAARLNYSANVSAQAVARGRTKSVALIVSDIADPYFSALAAGVFRAAEKSGLIVTIAMTERRPDREMDIVAALRGQRPQVLILAGSRTLDDANTARLTAELQAFEAEGGRVAIVSQPGLPFDTIALENRDGAHDLATELVDLGYREFAVLAGPSDLVTASVRTEGFAAGLAGRGIELDESRIVHGEFTRDGGYAAAGEVLRSMPGVEAIFAVNDVMAVGAMARLREAGLALPGDIAIAGFDDIATLRDVTPALTTVQLPLERVGRDALDLALAERSDGPVTERIVGRVVIRQSTPRLRVPGT